MKQIISGNCVIIIAISDFTNRLKYIVVDPSAVGYLANK